MRASLARALLLGAVALTACFARPFDPQSMVATLRVLAVRASHSTPPPGTDVSLTMLLHDGSPRALRADGTPRPIQIVWLSGCFDPAGDVYYQCYPSLAPALAALRSGTPSPAVGTGSTFTLRVPADIVSRRPVPKGKPAYGISYVFYAICAGKVVPVEPNDSSTPPLACLDEGGAEVSADGFVFGFMPLYSYPGIDNQNPTIDAGTFDGASLDPTTCVTDADCGTGACNGAKVCAPLVTKCSRQGTGCSPHTFVPKVDPASSEPDVVGSLIARAPRNERIYVQYFASRGTFSSDQRTAIDPVYGPQDAFSTDWTPPVNAGDVRLWAVVRDNRGGVTWWWQDVVVR